MRGITDHFSSMVEQHCLGDTGSSPVSGPNFSINIIINQNFTIMFEKGQVLQFEKKVVVVIATVKTDAVTFYFVANREKVFILMEKNLQAKLSIKEFNVFEISNKEKVEYAMFDLNIDGEFIDNALDTHDVTIID